MTTALHITEGDFHHTIFNLDFTKAEGVLAQRPGAAGFYDDGENEFVLNATTALDYQRWELRLEPYDENCMGLVNTFYATDVDHARRLAANTTDHYPDSTRFVLLDEEGEQFEVMK